MFWSLVLVLVLVLPAVDGAGWPKGKYALLKPTTGCPTGWQYKGWIFQDTEDTNPSNNKSEILHIDGYVHPSYVIRSFCVKTSAGQGYNWPKGKYCIYRKRNDGSLPGMGIGWIQMDDEKTSNKDTLIYVNYNDWLWIWSNRRFLRLDFRCMTSGNKKTPIELPITKPFYLLPYGSSECQQVKWMVATTEWIKYDLNNPSKNYFYGTRPFFKATRDSKGNEDITMFYCYYQSCNFTLTEKKGVFQSPGFPHKYPDGQLCSWTIMVPPNHTIHVHFTNFSLYGNDKKDHLSFYKYINGTFHIRSTSHSFMRPFTYTATTDLLFKFVSNEANNSLGFRAEFNVFIPPDSTQSPSTTTVHTSLRTNNPPTPLTEKIATENMSKNHTAFALESECKGIGLPVVIVIPLVCFIFAIVIVIFVVYRYRSKSIENKRDTSETRMNDAFAMNPTYDQGTISLNQRASTATVMTTMLTNDNDGQMYQTLSRDQPNYEAPDYSKQNNTNMDPEYPKLESLDNNAPDVLYDVLEGPDLDDGPPPVDQMYQAILEDQTTLNPLYEATNPDTMATKNHLYGSLA